jgi:hypothetical protein
MTKEQKDKHAWPKGIALPLEETVAWVWFSVSQWSTVIGCLVPSVALLGGGGPFGRWGLGRGPQVTQDCSCVIL